MRYRCMHAGLGFVDVRDVALAHSLALLDPRAKGRYILVSHSLNFLQMVRRAPFAWPVTLPG